MANRVDAKPEEPEGWGLDAFDTRDNDVVVDAYVNDNLATGALVPAGKHLTMLLGVREGESVEVISVEIYKPPGKTIAGRLEIENVVDARHGTLIIAPGGKTGRDIERNAAIVLTRSVSSNRYSVGTSAKVDGTA